MGRVQASCGFTEGRAKARAIANTGHAGLHRKTQKVLASIFCAAQLFASDPSLRSRTVQVEKQDVVPIYSTFNYSTIIVLPDKEQVMTWEAGEHDLWAINNTDHTVSVKPKLVVKLAHKKIDPTNINIIAASGNVYSVVVSEVSGTDQSADLKVILEQKDAEALANMDHPKFVRADYADGLKKALETSKEEAAQAKQTAVVSEVKEIRHDYEWSRGKEAEAFGLKSIYRDSRFTYIEAASQNAPSLYEVINGKESVVQYQLENGKYVVGHVMQRGVLRAGKTKLEFTRSKETL
jgi:type IV secretory pathway VirB9-like protein